jgi:flagellar biosynthesis/type III secretory pathway chaperone
MALCQEVISHLHWEGEHLVGQRDLLLREREHLLHRDLEGILECVKEKETLRTQTKILDESRATLHERLRAWAETRHGACSLGALAASVQEPERSCLLECTHRVEVLLREVDRLTEGNDRLIQSALGHIGRAIGFLSQFQGSGFGTYTRGGQMGWETSAPQRVARQV